MPQKIQTWHLTSQNGPSSLHLSDEILPEVGEEDVLVKIHAVSLNYRDLAISKGQFNLPLPTNPLTPGSDAAGIILSVGSNVTGFKTGDKVLTHMPPPTKPPHEPATFEDIGAGLGHGAQGTFRTQGVFHEGSLVRMPQNLGYLEGATLTCSGLTAWNALFGGAGGRGVREGDVVLVQGSGGVSVAGLQFALASKATVIATTSSDSKAAKLKALGAHHVLNYKTTPDWGAAAKALTPDGRGVDIVIDVGGPSTLRQSLLAIRPEGMIALTGFLGAADGEGDVPSAMDGLVHLCTMRGLLLGSRGQFEDMVRFVEEKGVKPVVDERVFGFEEVKEAYEYLEGQGHFSKVGVRIGDL